MPSYFIHPQFLVWQVHTLITFFLWNTSCLWTPLLTFPAVLIMFFFLLLMLELNLTRMYEATVSMKYSTAHRTVKVQLKISPIARAITNPKVSSNKEPKRVPVICKNITTHTCIDNLNSHYNLNKITDVNYLQAQGILCLKSTCNIGFLNKHMHCKCKVYFAVL